MWNFKLTFRAGRRLYHSRANKKVTEYLRDLSYYTKDPIWRLVTALHSPHQLSLSEALAASQVSLDDFSRWRSAFYASDIDQAPMQQNPPSWLVLYLAAFKIRTPQNASGSLMDLSFAHLQVAPPTIQGPLLVLAMMHLARFDLVQPMQRVIDAFLLVPLPRYQNVHFNYLLAAMTFIHQRSPQTGENAVKVLRAMEARQLRLYPHICAALLEDRYVALQLTAYLRRRMTGLGIVPTASHLEAFLRVYAADGAIHDARRYAAAIRNIWRLKGTREEQASTHANSVNRSNTSLVRAQPDSASAFSFLLTLANKTAYHDRPPPAGARPSAYPRPLLGKRRVNVYDATAALSVAARDPSVDAQSLIRLFARGRPKSNEFRATAAAHTVLIRALLLRHEHALAFTHWTKLARSGLPLDARALAAGLQAATLAGHPAEAFALLEAHGVRADLRLPAPYRLRRPLHVSTHLLTALMRALLRILRPDLVFALWDAMGTLYGATPDAPALRVLLAAAQLPHLLDDSLAGQIALLALKNPFRAPPAQPRTRAELAGALAALAAAPYHSGMWNARPAAVTAADIFVQAALSTPERLRIAQLGPPARAVRPHAESDPMAPGLGVSLSFDMPPSPFVLPDDILTPAGDARFPGVALTERDWHAYVELLGMTRRAPEIARALAWMRALNIQPNERTLGLALAFWGEVAVQPPLVAALVPDQYKKLVDWLREWCAEVPGEREVGVWRARIARVRRLRREMVEAGRWVDEDEIWGMECADEKYKNEQNVEHRM
ncbi:hypothetical protein FB451DRAFT_1142845 [Mycena latifolia]|nr:hypothetical protein FB451DRAFT_1142845 [Mycena latifolia]